MKLFSWMVFPLAIIYPIQATANPLNKLHGDIGVEYTKDSSKSSTETNINKLTQVLNLNYQDFIYDTRLIDYYFRLKFSEHDEKRTEDEKNSSSTFGTTEYDMRFNLFKLSDLPISLQAKQTEKPTTIINEDSIVETTFNKNEYSVDGKVNTNFVNVDYNVALTENNSSTELGKKNLETSLYRLGFSRELDHESRVSLNFSMNNSLSKLFYGDFLEEQRDKNSITTSYNDPNLYLYLSYTQRDEQDKDNSSINNYTIDHYSTSINYKISDTLKTSNAFDFEENTRDNATTNTAKVNFRWKPVKNYDASMTFNSDEHNIENQDYNNYSFDVLSNYRITPNLSNSQSASFLDVITPSSTHKSFLLSTVTNYKKQLTPKLRWHLNNTLSSITNKNTSLLENTTIEDDQSFVFDLTTGLLRNLGFWNASNGYDLNLGHTFTDDNTDTTKIRLSSFFNSMPSTNMEYNVDADVTNEKRNQDTTRTINVKNYLRYIYNFDVRGRLNVDSALNYKIIQTEDSSESSLDPSVTMNFNYQLWRTLNFKSMYSVMSDQLNKTISHTLNTGLHYKFRELEVNFTTSMISQSKKEDDDFDSQTLFLSIKRKF